jgi:hypothetical protein
MPTITVTITAGGNTIGRTKQISGPDLQNRFLPAYRALFAMMTLQPPGTPALTDDEVIQRWADDVLQRLKLRIKDHETTIAVIPPLDLT